MALIFGSVGYRQVKVKKTIKTQTNLVKKVLERAITATLPFGKGEGKLRVKTHKYGNNKVN